MLWQMTKLGKVPFLTGHEFRPTPTPLQTAFWNAFLGAIQHPKERKNASAISYGVQLTAHICLGGCHGFRDFAWKFFEEHTCHLAS